MFVAFVLLGRIECSVFSLARFRLNHSSVKDTSITYFHCGVLRERRWKILLPLQTDNILQLSSRLKDKEVNFLDTTVFKGAGERFNKQGIRLDIRTLLNKQRLSSTPISLPATHQRSEGAHKRCGSHETFKNKFLSEIIQ